MSLRYLLWEGWREKQSQTSISGGNFWKKHIFWKDFLQASKPGRGRVDKGQTLHPYVCKAVQILSAFLTVAVLWFDCSTFTFIMAKKTFFMWYDWPSQTCWGGFLSWNCWFLGIAWASWLWQKIPIIWECHFHPLCLFQLLHAWWIYPAVLLHHMWGQIQVGSSHLHWLSSLPLGIYFLW